jgi:hypothetical protein
MLTKRDPVRFTVALLFAVSIPLCDAAEVAFRLTKKDGVLQDYYDHPNDFPVCRDKLDYVSFSTGVDPLIRPDGQRLFYTQQATVEVFKGAGKNYAFTGKETVDAIAKYEAQGFLVKYAVVYREDWLFRKGEGGPWKEDVRILSEQELRSIRKAIAASNLKSKRSVELIQLLGARVQKHRGDTWYQIRRNRKLLKHLGNFDGVGTECHTNDFDGEQIDDGPRTLDSMAMIAKWAKDNRKKALVFMGGTAASYRINRSTEASYEYLWNRMGQLKVDKTEDHLIYFRQGARAGTHLPEKGRSLTGQLKWLIEKVKR